MANEWEESSAVRYAREQERRYGLLEANDAAILGHCERIEDHLAALNSKTNTNISDIANLRQGFEQHMRDIITTKEIERLLLVEQEVASLKLKQVSQEDINKGVTKGRSQVLSPLMKAYLLIGPTIATILGAIALYARLS